MIPLSREAQQQVSALRHHYESLYRVEAVINLMSALQEASDAIEREPAAGLRAHLAPIHSLNVPAKLG